MAPVDPELVLNRIVSLLDQQGGLKNVFVVRPFTTLMKLAEKLVKKSLYLQILRQTKSKEIFNIFVENQGDRVLFEWLKEFAVDPIDHHRLIEEIFIIVEEFPPTSQQTFRDEFQSIKELCQISRCSTTKKPLSLDEQGKRKFSLNQYKERKRLRVSSDDMCNTSSDVSLESGRKILPLKSNLSKSGVKKNVSWADEKHRKLVEISFYDHRSSSKEKFPLLRRILLPSNIVQPQIISRERFIQEEREKSVLQALILPRCLPESPSEADLDPSIILLQPAKLIPLDRSSRSLLDLPAPPNFLPCSVEQQIDHFDLPPPPTHSISGKTFSFS